MPVSPTVVLDSDVIKIRAVSKQNPQYSINVGYFQCKYVAGAGITNADIAAQIEVGWSANYLAWMSPVSQWWGLGVTVQTSIPTPETISFANRGNGTAGGQAAPPQATGLAKLTTAFAGRKYRGRKYIGFPSSNMLSADMGQVLAFGLPFLGNIAALWAFPFAATAGANSMTCSPVIRPKPPRPLVFIDNYVTRIFLATQRRRSEINRADVDPFNASY